MEDPFIQSIIEVGDASDETIGDGSVEGMVRVRWDEANHEEPHDDETKEENSENQIIKIGDSTIQSKIKKIINVKY